jgi:phosphoribosylformylglycinamidine cyclo-ligase
VIDYKASGVDIDAGNEVVRRIKGLARATFTPGVLSDIGAFGGLFTLDRDRAEAPVLVASADGVGTKLKVAFLAGRHDTIGQDLVNHCVNDILVQGATPLFFLDYFATGRLSPDIAVAVIQGLATACRANGCALLGGETAEMPGFYADGEYDLAGFIVGSVARDALIDGRSVAPGDVLIGLPSSGLHTNGYSLARRLVFEDMALGVHEPLPGLGASVGEALLVPHRTYLPVVRPLLPSRLIKAMAHITGGGITENLPRSLPEGTRAVVERAAWDVPTIFRVLQRAGSVPDTDMLRTFNMGIGLILIVAARDVERVRTALHDAGEASPRLIGHVERGAAGVRYA